MRFSVCLILLTLRLPVCAAESSAAPALTNWQVAMSKFHKAGVLIGDDKPTQAKAELMGATTNLPQPYNAMASQFLTQLDSALSLSTNHTDPQRLQALVILCTDLGAYQAALRLQTNQANASSDQLADDLLYAWRLFESGDTKAALAEYERRASKEPVETWQAYYQEQVRIIQQRSTNAANPQFAIEIVKERYLKGLEAHADLFGALSELTRVTPYLKSAKEALSIYQRILKCLAALDDEMGRQAWQDKLMSEFGSDPEVAAIVDVDRGQKAYHRKDINASEALFRKVASNYPKTSANGDALYGLGLVLQEQQKFDEAIAEYTKIFSSNANEELPDAESGEDFPNYRFRAALRISECYEGTKDLKKSLEYALMARDKYKFVSYCSDCLRETRRNVEDRVKRLQDLVNKPAASPTTQ